MCPINLPFLLCKLTSISYRCCVVFSVIFILSFLLRAYTQTFPFAKQSLTWVDLLAFAVLFIRLRLANSIPLLIWITAFSSLFLINWRWENICVWVFYFRSIFFFSPLIQLCIHSDNNNHNKNHSSASNKVSLSLPLSLSLDRCIQVNAMNNNSKRAHTVSLFIMRAGSDYLDLFISAIDAIEIKFYFHLIFILLRHLYLVYACVIMCYMLSVWSNSNRDTEEDRKRKTVDMRTCEKSRARNYNNDMRLPSPNFGERKSRDIKKEQTKNSTTFKFNGFRNEEEKN